ncbi:MAG TPA: HdeD family acid-resistance protein, partial [Ktedonobacterales bacterium]|nr:HdeD family acid-resistance protein [Ktedonobacterales bacterium]
QAGREDVASVWRGIMTTVHARNWWALVIRGVAAILFGIIALLLPGSALLALVLLFGAYALVDGIFALLGAIRAIESNRRFGALLFQGIVGVIIGILTFIRPGITGLVLLYLIAFWAIVTGVFEIIEAVEMRRVIRNEWLLILSGALSVIFGVVIFFAPVTGALAVVVIIGIYAIIFGALLIGLGLRLRSWEQHARHGFGATA